MGLGVELELEPEHADMGYGFPSRLLVTALNGYLRSRGLTSRLLTCEAALLLWRVLSNPSGLSSLEQLFCALCVTARTSPGSTRVPWKVKSV